MSDIEPIIIIPARMSATRLPGKPLADIHGTPMIVHVYQRAVQAGIGRVVVAAGEQEICDVVLQAGGEAVLTNPSLPTGSDRVYDALKILDPNQNYDVVVNVQGDLPTLDSSLLAPLVNLMQGDKADIASLVAKTKTEEELTSPNVVKTVISWDNAESKTGNALYFSRSCVPYGAETHYHHMGVYAYRRAALKRFVNLPPSLLEKSENLEQLRALEAGMCIRIACVDTPVPMGVDTPEDLEKAKKILLT